MTVKEYITSKFQQFGIKLSDADLADISANMDINSTLTDENRKKAYKLLAEHVIPQLLLRPTSVSEKGFTISWNMDALMKYYAWLCEMAGIEPVGLSTIRDMTDIW